jgi:Fic family protein
MQEFIEWFHQGPPREWPSAIQAIVAHFYVISIHPFQDGNGRTSRAVESFLLFRGGINARGFYSLANFYYRRRQEYENMLDYVRFETNGDLTPFVRFALNGLVEELEDVHAEVLHEVRLMAFRDYAREVIFNVGSADQAARMYNLVLGLGREAVPVAALRRGGHPLYELYRSYSSRTLRRDLDLLSAEGLIVIENKEIRADLDVMTQFAVPAPPTSS